MDDVATDKNQIVKRVIFNKSNISGSYARGLTHDILVQNNEVGFFFYPPLRSFWQSSGEQYKYKGRTIKTISIMMDPASTTSNGYMSSKDKAKLDTISKQIVIDCSSYESFMDVMLEGLGGQWDSITGQTFGVLCFKDGVNGIGIFNYYTDAQSNAIHGSGTMDLKQTRFSDIFKDSNVQAPLTISASYKGNSYGIYQDGTAIDEM